MLIKKLFAPLVAFCLAFGAGSAAADAPPPDQALKTTVDKLLGLIKDNVKDYRADSAKFYKVVDDIVVPRFDSTYITKLVLGLNYRTASDDQKARFTAAFKNMLVSSYANSMLDNYNSVKIDWQPVKMEAGATDAMVNSSLTKDNGKPYLIGFRVHLVDGDWKVYDINVENLSLVTNFRTQLNSEIKRTSLDAVIARMESGEFNPKPDDGGAKK